MQLGLADVNNSFVLSVLLEIQNPFKIRICFVVLKLPLEFVNGQCILRFEKGET